MAIADVTDLGVDCLPGATFVFVRKAPALFCVAHAEIEHYSSVKSTIELYSSIKSTIEHYDSIKADIELVC